MVLSIANLSKRASSLFSKTSSSLIPRTLSPKLPLKFYGNMTSPQDRKLLLIPGPIEFTDTVLQANAHGAMSHVAPEFIPVFGESIKLLRKVFLTETAQPFILSGSGTLGWDFAAANLVQPDDDVLLINTGYFGDGFADCLETYGIKVTHVTSSPGDRPSIQEIETALVSKQFKAISVTHVDTSTGVLSDLKAIAQLVKNKSANTLIFVDGVCSVGCEEMRFDEWGLDHVITASQKALGVPPGLSITMVSQRALDIVNNRKTIPAYFANYKRWLPIMQAYEAGKPSYFATPSVQLIYSLNTSLKEITAKSIEGRFKAHMDNAVSFRRELSSMGLNFVPKTPEFSANGMTAIYYPDGIQPFDLLSKLSQKGIQIAGGLHKEIGSKYFRIGHMGISATEPSLGHMNKVLDVLRESLHELGYTQASSKQAPKI